LSDLQLGIRSKRSRTTASAASLVPWNGSLPRDRAAGWGAPVNGGDSGSWGGPGKDETLL